MIGAPPGYVGYDEAGQLTEAVRRRPYAVVLFDEVEKHTRSAQRAAAAARRRPADGWQGRTVDFKNTVVIMTSNIGQGMADVMDAVRAHFRPEFINRIDEIIQFHALDREHMKQIIDIQVTGLMKRLEERKIHVVLTDAAKDQIVRVGYDPTYGAGR